MTELDLSFEFFPPRSAVQERKFWRTLGCLETLSPVWVSMTYGALGTASQASLDTIAAMRKDTATPVAAHLTCAGHTLDAMNEIVDSLLSQGVTRFVALRGDGSTEQSGDADESPLKHATDLVALLSRHEGVDISVAAYPEVHPEAASAESDLYWLRAKFEAGAARALTQFFFDADVFLRWRDKAVRYGIDQPLVPGILPIHDIDKVIDFSARCGASVPESIIKQFRAAGDGAARRRLAISQSVKMCRRLQAEGVSNFHLYTLNQSTLSYAVAQELREPVKATAAA